MAKVKASKDVKVKKLPMYVAPLPKRKGAPKERFTCSVEPRALAKLDSMCSEVGVSRGELLETMIFENRSSAFERLKDLEGANSRLAAHNKALADNLQAEKVKHQYDIAKLKREFQNAAKKEKGN